MIKSQMAALLALLQSLIPDDEPAAPAAPVEPVVNNTPAGVPVTVYDGPMVAVRPTGVLAEGVVRWWPEPLAGQRWFDYLMWCTSIKREDGLPFIAPQYRATIVVDTIGSAGYRKAFPPSDFPWRADAFAHPEEWRSQEQIDQTERDLAGWGESHQRMQERYSDAPADSGSV